MWTMTEEKVKPTNAELKKILNIGIKLSTEKNREHLLASILENGMDITHCDASTLYLFEDGKLRFKIMKTLSQNISRGEDGELIDDMPPVPMTERNVCSYAALHREIINIPDVYNDTRFDFSGPKKYDALTGYHTQSLLVIPIENNEDELIGVLQLLNAMDEEGNVIPFDSEYEIIIRSLGAQAAIEMTNLQYVQEVKRQLRSFVEAMSTAIDERTPYNGSHTRKVAEYAGMIADYINKQHQAGACDDYFDENRKDKLELAALLHDIGKMVVPLSIMNRATRLDRDLGTVETRFRLLEAYYMIDKMKGRIDEAEYQKRIAYLRESMDFIHRIDGKGILDDADYDRVQELAGHSYVNDAGEPLPYLTKREKDRLSIRKGTLTEDDRRQMEYHVVMTEKILGKVRFNKNYEEIPKWAASHHELLDGSGYPRHLKGADLALETRMITVADVYDALTARDRPYKKPVSQEKALGILKDMADEGKLDCRLVEYLAAAVREKEGKGKES